MNKSISPSYSLIVSWKINRLVIALNYLYNRKMSGNAYFDVVLRDIIFSVI